MVNSSSACARRGVLPPPFAPAKARVTPAGAWGTGAVPVPRGTQHRASANGGPNSGDAGRGSGDAVPGPGNARPSPSGDAVPAPRGTQPRLGREPRARERSTEPRRMEPRSPGDAVPVPRSRAPSLGEWRAEPRAIVPVPRERSTEPRRMGRAGSQDAVPSPSGTQHRASANGGRSLGRRSPGFGERSPEPRGIRPGCSSRPELAACYPRSRRGGRHDLYRCELGWLLKKIL